MSSRAISIPPLHEGDRSLEGVSLFLESPREFSISPLEPILQPLRASALLSAINEEVQPVMEEIESRYPAIHSDFHRIIETAKRIGATWVKLPENSRFWPLLMILEAQRDETMWEAVEKIGWAEAYLKTAEPPFMLEEEHEHFHRHIVAAEHALKRIFPTALEDYDHLPSQGTGAEKVRAVPASGPLACADLISRAVMCEGEIREGHRLLAAFRVKLEAAIRDLLNEQEKPQAHPYKPEGAVFDPVEREDFPGCDLCEWCHFRPAERHEDTHDAYLCIHCTENVAPESPVLFRLKEWDETEIPVPLPTSEEGRYQMVHLAMNLLMIGLGRTQDTPFGNGADVYEGKHRLAALYALWEVAESVKFIDPEIRVPFGTLCADRQYQEIAFPYVYEAVVLYPNRSGRTGHDRFTRTLYHACRAMAAKDAFAGYEEAHKALLFAKKYLNAALSEVLFRHYLPDPEKVEDVTRDAEGRILSFDRGDGTQVLTEAGKQALRPLLEKVVLYGNRDEIHFTDTGEKWLDENFPVPAQPTATTETGASHEPHADAFRRDDDRPEPSGPEHGNLPADSPAGVHDPGERASG